jgi:hypothetical protein
MLYIAAKRVGSQSKVCSILPNGNRTFMAWQHPGLQATHGLELTDSCDTVLNNLKGQGYMLTPGIKIETADENPMTFAKRHARHFSDWINTGIPPKELVDLGLVITP